MAGYCNNILLLGLFDSTQLILYTIVFDYLYTLVTVFTFSMLIHHLHILLRYSSRFLSSLFSDIEKVHFNLHQTICYIYEMLH